MIGSGLSTQEFYGSIQAMISELGDEHSYFFSPVEVAASEAEFAGSQEFVGIGVFFLPLEAKNRISIITVYPDSPAEHAGLKPHDSILAVDGIPVVQNGKALPHLVRGPQCSIAVLTVQSPNEAARTVTLVRQRIQSPKLVQAQMLPTSEGSRVGYILLPSFGDETVPGQVADALDTFGQLDGLILDNRVNGGGDSRVVELILSYFTSGTLGTYETRTDSFALTVEPDPIQNSQTVPLVVLVSRKTVSYGEIFSGVLKDSGRAQIVGELTLGNVELLKGYDFDDGSQLWIAAQTFLPAVSGQDWEQTGIIPDVTAYADWDTFTFETDPSIAAALKLLGQ
jgi:carboxyl-terminal processing protease